MIMARFRYLGGDQRPDAFGVLTVGDVLDLGEKPDWGDWESAGNAEAERAPTPQPAYVPAGPESDPWGAEQDVATPVRLKPVDESDDEEES